jgi:trehalose 2-sulfotransferase
MSYLICTTPRTGSNLLCELLQSTGAAGRPDDYFWNPPFWQERWGTPDFSGYVERMLQEGTSANGAFGVKMMRHYLDDLLPGLAGIAGLSDADPSAVLSRIFPSLQYVWLTRRDKVRQGISLYRALATSAWRSTDRRPGPGAEPEFSFTEIDRLVQQSIAADRSWQAYFERYGIEPLAVAYEDLAARPEETVRAILRHLDLPLPEGTSPSAVRHQRQADAGTDDWVRRYHAHQTRPPDA